MNKKDIILKEVKINDLKNIAKFLLNILAKYLIKKINL